MNDSELEFLRRRADELRLRITKKRLREEIERMEEELGICSQTSIADAIEEGRRALETLERAPRQSGLDGGLRFP